MKQLTPQEASKVLKDAVNNIASGCDSIESYDNIIVNIRDIDSIETIVEVGYRGNSKMSSPSCRNLYKGKRNEEFIENAKKLVLWRKEALALA